MLKVENHYHYSLALNYERDSLSITGRPAADQSYEIQTHFSVTVAGFTKGDRLQDLERPKELFNYLRLSMLPKIEIRSQKVMNCFIGNIFGRCVIPNFN